MMCFGCFCVFNKTDGCMSNYCFSNFILRAGIFVGDKTGVLHIGPGQHAVVQHADDLEFLVNVIVYEGGSLFLPKSFMCVGITITVK